MNLDAWLQKVVSDGRAQFPGTDFFFLAVHPETLECSAVTNLNPDQQKHVLENYASNIESHQQTTN